MSKSITELFGELVFDEDTMEQRLPKDTFRELQKNNERRAFFKY